EKAKKYHQISNGYFEPTLLPLIKNWGSSLKNKEQMDSTKVDSLMKFVSFKDLIKFNSAEVKALKQGVEIDLSAMGEGYALDAIASILNKSGVNNYMIEIGGEMTCKGVNAKGKVWQIGIENPTVSIEKRETSLMKRVELKNKG